MSSRISRIDRIIVDIPIKVCIAPGEQDGVFSGPAAGVGIIIAGTEAGEAGVVVIEAACKTKGLEAGVAVLGDLSPDIIVQPLDHAAILSVNDQAGTAQMITEDAVGEAVFDQIIGRVATSGIDKAADDLVVTIQRRSVEAAAGHYPLNISCARQLFVLIGSGSL